MGQRRGHARAVRRFASSLACCLFLVAGCIETTDCPAGSVPSPTGCVAEGVDAGPRDTGPADASDAGGAGDTGRPDVGSDAPDAVDCVPAPDEPDETFADTNCDGIDGDVSMSVFVDATAAAPGLGTIDAPFPTLAAGIAAAQAGGSTYVLVATGIYTEELDVLDGISVVGGYDAEDGWARSSSNSTVTAAGIALSAIDIVTPTRIASFSFISTGTRSGNSIAAFIDTSAALTLEDVELVANVGDEGASGSARTAGARGRDSNPGVNGVRSGPDSVTCGGPVTTTAPAAPVGRVAICGCGTGGDAGAAGGFVVSSVPSPAGAGLRGRYLMCSGTADGGAPGAGGTGVGPGIPGTVGATGTTGAPGTAASAIGTAEPLVLYRPADGDTGESGGDGAGGGGGGGGVGCALDSDGFCWGSGGTGGAGGSGGCGGPGGDRGLGGGASIALYVSASTVTLIDVTLRPGTGGAGGSGTPAGAPGGGGRGSMGGLRWNGTTSCYGTGVRTGGGAGGDGGPGGPGGGGSGGTGGPSIGIVLTGGSSIAAGSTPRTYVPGTGGAAGAGGGTAPAGSVGMVMEEWTVP